MRTSNLTSTWVPAGLPFGGCQAPPKTPATESERTASEANDERIKALSGEWHLVHGVRLDVELEPNRDDPFVSQAVGSGGHSVIEQAFAGKSFEMTSVSYLDPGRLLIAIPGAEDEIPFRLVTVSNLSDEDELHLTAHGLDVHGPRELIATGGATRTGVPTNGSRYWVQRTGSR